MLVKDWTAAEELALISGIMKCGLGNWEDVQEQFLQHRTPQECEEHYFSVVYKSSSKQDSDITYNSVMIHRAP
jgi:hypothetical protein